VRRGGEEKEGKGRRRRRRGREEERTVENRGEKKGRQTNIGIGY